MSVVDACWALALATLGFCVVAGVSAWPRALDAEGDLAQAEEAALDGLVDVLAGRGARP